MPKLLQGYSDKMWEQGKSLLKYGLKRGSKFSDSDNSKMFYLDVPTGTETFSEVSALGTSLDMMKQHAEDAIITYKHANNRNNHNHGQHGDVQDNNANGNSVNGDKYFSGPHTNSYDPSVRISLKLYHRLAMISNNQSVYQILFLFHLLKK